MAVYTVHEPPQKPYTIASEPERFAFVRDGFSFWALLFGPLWMLRHRMWLVLLGYVAVVTSLEIVFYLTGASMTVRTIASLMLALLVAIEAGTLRRFTLGRRRYRNLGIVVGDDLESAERRFFDAWAIQGVTPAASFPAAAPVRAPTPAPGVIGLFPEPGASR